ncbi:hypothetical protein RJ640_020553 [Escallonia rubra]|uniref:Tr-type G domain-containing protein n=1 Tax=Escallonia rubra TaxID=112253 RepID=A0AA88RJI6_9ASTE|nr:hypothetical protein RJ640_020553 [Escallonia rubra]
MVRSARFSTTRFLYSLCSTSSKPPPPHSPISALLAWNLHPRRFSLGSAARAREPKEAWWKESMERLRNIGISAHIDSGKTTLTERILYYTGPDPRGPGEGRCRGEDGVDGPGEGKGDHHTVCRHLLHLEWLPVESYRRKDKQKGFCCKLGLEAEQVNIIDTPGHVDFTIEVERALRVLDGAILVLCSVGGVQSQSITVDRQMRRYEVPRLAFINKLDRMGADPWKVLSQARAKLRHNSAAVQVPIGLEDDFQGLVDIVHLKANTSVVPVGLFHKEKVVSEEIPSNIEALVAEKRRELIEVVSEVDDKLAEAFLSDEPISSTDLEEAIRRATISQRFIPVFMGSALKNKFSKALNQFQREDPTFRVGLDAESGQTIISGMGELHVDIYVERIRREYKVDATVGKPRVNFRETVTQRADFTICIRSKVEGRANTEGYGKGEFTMEYKEHSPVSNDVQMQLVNTYKLTYSAESLKSLGAIIFMTNERRVTGFQERIPPVLDIALGLIFQAKAHTSSNMSS